jgi:hypothetical protein
VGGIHKKVGRLLKFKAESSKLNAESKKGHLVIDSQMGLGSGLAILHL